MASLPAIVKSKSAAYTAPITAQKKNKGHKDNLTKHRHLPKSQQLSEKSAILATAEFMIKEIPMQYLKSKPELRKYAIDIACTRLVKPFERIKLASLKKAFSIWKSPPVIQLNEKQFGTLVICKVFANVFDHMVHKAFMQWAGLYSSRHNPLPLDANTIAVLTIQRWYRYQHSTLRRVLKTWYNMVQVCVRRNKAIKQFLLFEKLRYMSLQKVRLGISLRRRYFFACRSIQRIWRWKKKCIRVSKRLRRVYHARILQQWWKALRKLDKGYWLHIGVIVRAGGFYKVFSKVPHRFAGRGCHESLEACAAVIQKAYFSSCGKFALYLRIAASKEKRAQELLLDRSARTIANSYLAYRWRLFMTRLFVYNRARRIQRAIKSYVCRLALYKLIQARRERCARRIQAFMVKYSGLRRMYKRFEVRRSRIALERCSVGRIIHAYRSHVVWVTYKRHRNKKYYDALRGKAQILFRSAAYIQKVWRKHVHRFPYHIYVIMKRLAADKARFEYEVAAFLQHWIKKYLPPYIERKRLALLKLRNSKATIIQKLVKTFLLKNAIHYRVIATFNKKTRASKRLSRNIRLYAWRVLMSAHFVAMKERFAWRKVIYSAATAIQRGLVMKHREYYMPMRVAARIQVKKKAEHARVDAIAKKERIAARRIQNFFRKCNQWKRTLTKLDKIRKAFRRDRARRRLRNVLRFVSSAVRFLTLLRLRREREKKAARDIEEQHALAVIGFYYRRHRELNVMKTRFEMRARMLEVLKSLEDEKKQALEEMRQSEENMKATIAASWKQGSDATGRNYYYNYVTGESRWTPPEDWNVKPADQWVRNVDERGNVYYYNIKTGKSRWLPPCNTCGKQSEKWCMDCGVSYCDKHYDAFHNNPENEDESLKQHTWTLTEEEREKLDAGETYCVECRKRKAVEMCTSCWDPYCIECFKYTHKSGNLRKHRTIEYKRAKKGWICVKAREEGEMDYYINGSSGETTYEKPVQLMTPQERQYYQNFITHKEAAEKYVAEIEKLQVGLEAASYERDRILFEKLTKDNDESTKPSARPVPLVSKGGGLNLFGGGDQSEYRKYVMQPTGRRRGKERSDYIKGLLEQVVSSNNKAGNKS